METKPTYYVALNDNGGGNVRTSFMYSFLSAFQNINIHLTRFGDSHPDRLRNRIAAAFLGSPCEYLLFIDSDIVFGAANISKMMECDNLILGGVYFLKTKEVQPCLSMLPGSKPTVADRIIPVARTGTGFLRIHRSVFEKLKETCKSYDNGRLEEWDFFSSGVYGREWLSEDWAFCDAARAAGFTVDVDLGNQVGHEGSIKYPLVDGKDRLPLCPANMIGHIEELWQGEYDIKEYKGTPDTILDIGANIGGFTVWANEQWPSAKIDAYEPHPDNQWLWHKNTNHVKTAEFHPVAVDAESGRMTLAEGANNCGEHSLYFNGEGPTVDVIASRFLPAADFIKLDCEGSELNILKNYQHLKTTNAVALEYHAKDIRDGIIELLSANGFREVHHKTHNATRGILHFIK